MIRPAALVFWVRFGNNQYDGPDDWAELGSSKMQQQPSSAMWLTGVTTEAPEDGAYPWSLQDWWDAYWGGSARDARSFCRGGADGAGVESADSEAGGV